MALPLGAEAPNFTLITKTESGLEPLTLSDNFGRFHTLLLFIPAAFTSVCTEELCSVSQDFAPSWKPDVKVWGVSVDSPFAQSAWAAQAGITFPLLSDYQREVTRAYDVEWPNLAGLGPSSASAVVLIDRNGIVSYTEVTENPGVLPNFEALNQALSELD